MTHARNPKPARPVPDHEFRPSLLMSSRCGYAPSIRPGLCGLKAREHPGYARPWRRPAARRVALVAFWAVVVAIAVTGIVLLFLASSAPG